VSPSEPRNIRSKLCASVAAATLLLLHEAHAADITVAGAGLADLSLEQLAQVEVTSVSGYGERLSDAAASIFVITNEDIRRAGVTTLPEALRLAPNLQVARVDAGQYAITARGSNNAIGNKLLVLVDGRSIYAPFFSGVLWDAQDLMLEDVERIEVISGPGGTLWGTNAVNGVINVVTRSAKQTQGALATARAGNAEGGAAFRYGAKLGGNGNFRVFAKSEHLRSTETAAGTSVPDAWTRMLGGFRADWSDAVEDLMLQGNAAHGKSEFRGVVGTFQLTPIDTSDVNLVGEWKRRLADGSDIRVQAYVDHSIRDDALLWRPREDIVDIQFQHGLPLGNHRILWGAGYRRAQENLEPGLSFGFVPQKSSLAWTSLFAQDEVRLGRGLQATLGTRVENNVYTGTELLPSARIGWNVSSSDLLWAAASRAVRAPAPLDRTVRLPPVPPYVIAGGPDFHSEIANVYEAGYRGQPLTELTLSITGFYEAWRGLRSGQTPPNAMVQNKIDGHVEGLELWGSWQVASAWRLNAGLTTLHKDLRLQPDSTDPVGPSNMGNDPHYQWMLRSSFDLPRRQEVDVTIRRVAALPVPVVPAYTAVDMRYGWFVQPNLELSIALRNAFDPSHPEYEAAPGRSEIRRSAFLQVKWSH
jgi:iron complex outermembrane receptor protein